MLTLDKTLKIYIHVVSCLELLQTGQKLSKKGAFQENSIVNLRNKRTSTINRVKLHILRIFSGQTTADSIQQNPKYFKIQSIINLMGEKVHFH